MMSCAESVVQLVRDNSVDDFLKASAILMKYATNVLEHPSEGKYRKIRLTNPNVQNILLTVSGGLESLFEMGFEEDGDFLTLPEGKSLNLVKKVRDDLVLEQNKLQNRTGPVSSSHAASMSTSSQVSQPASQAMAPATRSTAEHFVDSEAQFLDRLKSGLSQVMQYESPSAKAKAKQVIPVQELMTQAEENLRASGGGDGAGSSLREHFLLALLRWFKTSFFQWVDTLPCSFCGGKTQNTGSLQPTLTEVTNGAGRVEAHTCTVCFKITRFPRINNPVALLDSRKGRCGEWANCFTLCCRALDFEARHVLDWTDHVWTEVYSESQQRWLHCDPCENICDKPLLYESGWGKKLTYVIAFAKDDIQDVTWRYSAKHEEILSRRTLCRESWLCYTLHRLWKEKVSALPELRKHLLLIRLIKELIELLSSNVSSMEALPGRSTGSLEWRTARGELGDYPQTSATSENHVLKPTQTEVEQKFIQLSYSCAQDLYVRKSGDEKTKGWQNLVHSVKDVFRKEEFDWQTVYLARREGTSSAEITWKFDFGDAKCKTLELKAASAVYEDGSVTWRICSGDNCFMQSGSSLQEFMTFDLAGTSSLSITADLKRGKGDNAWQHTQLFRQKMNDKEDFSLDIKIHLE